MKKYDSLKVHGHLQRLEEIKEHCKIISLRPSVTHASKKKYSRKSKHNEKY